MPRKAKADAAAPVSEPKVEEAPKMEEAPKAKPAPKARAARKSKAAPKEPAEQIIIQSGGAEWDLSVLKEKAVSAYIAEGHRRGRISSMTLYVKPEDRKIYYVINGKTTGSADFD